MTDEKSLVPKLRFPGFTGAWERRKLGDIVDRVVRKNKNLESTLPLTISAQLGLVDQITYFNKRVAGKDLSNYYLIKRGEFAYNKSYSDGSPWGTIKRLDRYDQGVLSTLYIVFMPVVSQIDSTFLLTFFETNLWHGDVSAKASEGARNHGLLNISPSDFFDTGVDIPREIDEQYQIGAFFKQLDDLIALYQRKLSHLEQLKKGLLQKMFPKPGEAYPEIRFPGFTGAWQQRKLGEVIQLVGGGTPSKANPSFWKGNIVWLSSQEIKKRFIDHGTFKISQVAVEKSATKLVSAGTPLIVYRSGILAHSFPITRPTISVAINQDIKALLFDKMMLKQQFVVSQLESREQFVLKNIVKTGTTVQSVNIPDFVRMTFLIPSVEEQSKLSDLFNGLDDFIALRRRKLSHLQQLKKALLQQMFV